MPVCPVRPMSGAIFGAMLIALVPADGLAQTPPSMFGRDAVARALGVEPARVPVRVQVDVEEKFRACPGCPERRLLRPYLESLALNVMYNGINHLRGHPTARVGFNSWWANMKHGFEWDNNPWAVNQIGHQYQGSNYFTAGRAHGLSFWEASAVAAFGSATWEYFYENNRASLNDFINTTVGGIAIGEVLHRTAWLIRDPTATGKRRKKREIFAAMIDPMNGLSRVLSGDAERVAPKPPDMVPSTVGFRVAMGGHWQGSSLREATSTVRPYAEFELLYGDARTGSSTMPFEAFTVQTSVGGSLSHTAIRGRLFGRPFGDRKAGQVSIFQTYEFITNRAYAFGGQGFELEVGVTRALSPRASLWLAATGGATILAAADSLLPPPDGVTVAPPANGRTYDYGPGARFGGVAQVIRNGQPIAGVQYQAYQVNVVDGTRANHILQRLYMDVRVPVSRRLAVGAAGEYFFRKSYFWAAGSRTDRSPQFRLFLAWSRS